MPAAIARDKELKEIRTRDQHLYRHGSSGRYVPVTGEARRFTGQTGPHSEEGADQETNNGPKTLKITAGYC
jgi:hypothetical protein